MLLLIVGGIPLSVVDRVLTSYYQSVIIDDRIANLSTQAVTLADAISKYQSVSANNVSNFSSLVQQYSTVNEARIFVVNATYVIELDTYSFDKGKTDLSENVISTFKNRNRFEIVGIQVFQLITKVVGAGIPVGTGIRN